jgi:cell division protein FtsB
VKKPNAAPAADPHDRDPSDAAADEAEPGPSARADGLVERVDLSGLSIAGITRRRVGWLAAGLLACWIVVVFARQVGDAGAAATRAEQMAADNAALAAEVQSLQNEVDMIVKPEYVAIAARGHGLGEDHEIPFTLGPSVAAPVDGAPGSASVRLGASVDHQTPLESWLSLLFGPGS